MRVSIVICTYNRAQGLRATLDSLLLQRYRNFEVVVVNGPSTDGTAAVLRAYPHPLRVVDNPLANLSASRNIGIRAAAGEVVAFIDDDALPEPSWLEQALPAFADPEVAGVGGIVIDHTGMALQYRYSAATRFGEGTFSVDRPYDDFCRPGAAVFPYLQGTNAIFRTSALAQIGLFDETFDFYLDETDVCCRLVDAGYVLRQIADSPVHHKYLPSARRNEARVVTNWRSIMRNFVYFGYRHALLEHSEFDVMAHTNRFLDSVLSDAQHHERLGNAPIGHVARAEQDCSDAITEGMRLGREAGTSPLPAVVLNPPEFLPFLRRDAPNSRLRVVLVSSGYQPDITGGIARFISDVAPALAERGHEVRVFTRTVDSPTVDLEDGVWVHRLQPVPTPARVPEAASPVDGFASAVGNELERIAVWWEPDVMYGSLWDVEMLGVARTHPELPVVPILATPVAEVAEHEGWLNPNHPTHLEAAVLIELEREMIARSAIVHAISQSIVETFEGLYPGALADTKVVTTPIGRADDVKGTVTPIPSGAPVVTFLGRLEPRKGIDAFLEAARLLLARHTDLKIVVAGDDQRVRPDGHTYPKWWDITKPVGGDRLVFSGRIDDDDAKDLLHRSTVVVMPSKYESFGLVAVEAMMFGRPIVASRIGGLKEVVDDEETGLLVPVDEPQILADAIERLITNRDFAANMASRARSKFEREYTAAVAAERLEAVLTAAIAVATSKN